jgi:hypothetical protein
MDTVTEMVTYHILNMPNEHRSDNGDTIQIFSRRDDGTLDYVTDYTGLKCYCRRMGWPIPARGDVCELPGAIDVENIENIE